MSAFLLCFAAWTALALGMERHHEDAFGTTDPSPRHAPLPGLKHPWQHPAYLQRAGWALLVLSLWLAAGPSGPAGAPAGAVPTSINVVAWVVALSVSAMAVTAVVTWQPRRAPALAAVALAAGLWAQAWGW